MHAYEVTLTDTETRKSLMRAYLFADTHQDAAQQAERELSNLTPAVALECNQITGFILITEGVDDWHKCHRIIR